MTGGTTSIRTLEERLQLLEDQQAIIHTLNQYARSLDYQAVDSFIDCFVEDGVWRSQVDSKFAGSGGITVTGHEELRAWALKEFRFWAAKGGTDTPWGGTQSVPHKHMYTDLDIQIDGDTASCWSYYLVPAGAETGPYFHSIGRYEDKLVRCSDGKWRFRDRSLHREGTDPASQSIPVG